MKKLTAEARAAATRIARASGLNVADVVSWYRDAAKRGVVIREIILDGKCYNIGLPGIQYAYDAALDLPGRFMSAKCYNIGRLARRSAHVSGSKGVRRARANGLFADVVKEVAK